jgi:hypothetical protein
VKGGLSPETRARLFVLTHISCRLACVFPRLWDKAFSIVEETRFSVINGVMKYNGGQAPCETGGRTRQSSLHSSTSFEVGSLRIYIHSVSEPQDATENKREQESDEDEQQKQLVPIEQGLRDQ